MADAVPAVVSDPSDWLTTALPKLQSLDAALRCQICKDFFTNAVMTKCGHTFCSLCIRRSLSAGGRCPTCRTTENETALRRNDAIQEVVDAFLLARTQALDLAMTAASETLDTSARKRKRKVTDELEDETRSSQSRRRSTRNRRPQHDDVPQDETMQDVASEVHSPPPEPEPADGLVPCPICNTRMKEEFIFNHLDSPACRTASSPPAPASTPKPPSTKPIPTPDRLPQLNYSLFKDSALRSKLNSLGIPSWGPKQLLQRRHTEWTNMWNANCDAARPRPKRALLNDLDRWERSEGGSARSSDPAASQVMAKDFDGKAWATTNKTDFDDLIAKARAGRAKATSPSTTAEPPTDSPNLNNKSPPQNPSTPPEAPLKHPNRSPKKPKSPNAHLSSSRRSSNSDSPVEHSPYIPGAGGSDSRRGSATWSNAGFNTERSMSSQVAGMLRQESSTGVAGGKDSPMSSAGSPDMGLIRRPMFSMPAEGSLDGD